MGTVVDFPQQGTIGTSLKPKRYDIEVYQGDSFRFKLVFKDASMAVIDITGWAGILQIKEVDTATLVSSATITLSDPTNGEATVDFGDTNLLAGGDYKYDVQFTDTGGNKRTYIGGKITVTEDISE